MELGLDGKRVLITGASKGIGAVIAKRFLEEGATVFVVSRGSTALFDVQRELQESFGKSRVLAEKCDCTNLKSLAYLLENVVGKLGGIDIVVANVGDGRSVPDALPDDEQWRKTWDNNFESTLQTTRTFLPLLKESKGCLLFISSITGIEALGAPVDYSTAKAAVGALAKNMARKLGKELRVNVLAPGNIFFSGGSWDKKINDDPVRTHEFLEVTVPMNRFGTPDEVADAAVFLCSERASFITGSTLVVDGGQTVGRF
jgi:3-oxoacyl-[acyl-carrier protein] reductase